MKPSILTPTKIIVLMVVAALFTVANQRGPRMWVNVTVFMFWFFVLNTILFRKRLSPADAALFFIATSTAATMPYIDNWRLALPYAPKFLSPALWEKVSQVVPPFMVVPVENLESVVQGGAAVPWGAWSAPLMYFILLNITILMLGLSLAAFWSKQFIAIEKLPFPSIVPQITLLELGTTYEDSRPRLFNISLNRAFWLMFVVGAIVGTVTYVVNFSKTKPMPWTDQWPIDFRPYLGAILPGAWLYWWPAFSFDFIGYAYLAPIDLLVSIIAFFFIFYWIYPAVGIATGFLPPTAQANKAVPGFDWPTIFPYRLWQMWSIPIALGLAPIVFNWEYMIAAFKKLFRKPVEYEQEPGEIPFSWSVGGLAIFSLLFIALFSAAGAPPIITIIWLAIWLIIQTANIQFVGYYVDFPHRYFHALSFLLWPVGQGIGAFTANPALNTAQFGTAFMIGMTDNFWSQDPLYPWGMMRNFKLGYELKLSFRDTFVANAIAIIIGTIACYMTYVGLSYTLGLSGPRWFRDTDVTKSNVWGPARWKWFWAAKGPEPNPWRVGWWVVGIVLALILQKLRMTYPWFPLNLIGVFFAWHPWFVGSAIIALALKLVTLKIGGARWYERYGVPSVAGYIIGYAVFGTLISWFETIWMLMFNEYFHFF